MCFTTAFSFSLRETCIYWFAVLPKCLKDRNGTQMWACVCVCLSVCLCRCILNYLMCKSEYEGKKQLSIIQGVKIRGMQMMTPCLFSIVGHEELKADHCCVISDMCGSSPPPHPPFKLRSWFMLKLLHWSLCNQEPCPHHCWLFLNPPAAMRK